MLDLKEATLATVRAELEYRRKKQWDIFAWSMTVLVASIGGMFALAAKGEFKLALLPRAGFAIGLLAIAWYAWKWIGLNMDWEGKARERLLALLKDAGMQPTDIPDAKEFWFGYQITVLVGVAAALIALAPPSLLRLG